MKTIYIAGKISGLPFDEAVKKFAKAQSALEDEGYDVINPVAALIDYNERRRDFGLPRWTEEKDRAQILRFCISNIIMKANAVYLLSDWYLSTGAKMEADIAATLGLELLFENRRAESVDITAAEVQKNG